MPDAGVLATVLLIAGLFLLGLEFFVPSFGLIGTTAGLCLVVSLWSATKAWGGGASPTLFWTYLCFLLAGVPGTLLGAYYAIQHTNLGRSVVLRPPVPAVVQNPLEELLGRVGEAETPLIPGGMVVVDHARYHAQGQGMLIERRTSVVVVGVSGNRLVVRPVTEVTRGSSAGAGTEGTAETPEGKAKPSDTGQRRPVRGLDFDIPEDYTA